jgi:hypothetical protein
MNEIRYAAHFPGNYHWKTSAHGFVHRKTPGFGFGGKHEYVYGTVKRGQFGLVDEASEYHIVELVVRAEAAQFRL